MRHKPKKKKVIVTLDNKKFTVFYRDGDITSRKKNLTADEKEAIRQHIIRLTYNPLWIWR